MRVLAGRYELGGILGSGGMADVYRATDRVLGRDVAVKVLRTTAEAAASARARFDAEPLLLASLSHPGLVTVLDAGTDGQDAYLVMELLDGPTLRARLQEQGPVPLEELVALGAGLAQALASAHGRGVVHRDVKPSNIVLCAGRPVLTDFGIARYVTDSADLTAVGEVIGSPAYLAPEQVNGLEASPAVDVYALGLVLLEAYTGTRAYPGPPLEAAVARLTVAPAVPVSMGPRLRDLIERMVALDPAERPTAAEVAAALGGAEVAPDRTAVLDLSELTAAAVPVAVPADVPVRRRRSVALAAAGVIAAACLGLVAIDQLNPDEVAATDPGPSPSATPTSSPAVVPAAVSTPTAKPAPKVTKKKQAKPPGHAKPGKPGKPGKGHKGPGKKG